jgi:hypothetical protein
MVLLAGIFLLAGSALAQESQAQEKARTFTFAQTPMTVVSPNGDMIFQRERIGDGEVSFFSAEMTSGDVVTAAPYTATAVTESTQVLADGNRIVNKNSSFVARDSQGRTRRETTLNRIGPLQVDSPKMVFINDPTNHTQYILTPGDTTATKVVKGDGSNNAAVIDLHTQGGVVRQRVTEEKIAIAKSAQWQEIGNDEGRQVKHENLGTQTIEGVSAEGTRETVTIAAGQVGNEKPIEMITEIWTSPELHTVVMRKHSDPRMGETVFRLTDIKRGEPDASLFQVPANAKVRVERTIQLHREGQPKE